MWWHFSHDLIFGFDEIESFWLEIEKGLAVALGFRHFDVPMPVGAIQVHFALTKMKEKKLQKVADTLCAFATINWCTTWQLYSALCSMLPSHVHFEFKILVSFYLFLVIYLLLYYVGSVTGHHYNTAPRMVSVSKIFCRVICRWRSHDVAMVHCACVCVCVCERWRPEINI